jgi:glutaredoxin 3
MRFLNRQIFSFRKFNLFNKPPTNINLPIMQAEIDTFINSNKIAIISKSYCPFCTTAKKAFQGIGAQYQVLEIEDREDCQAIQDYMGKITGARSVPRVFINGRFEGGGDDIAAKSRSGALKKLCE